MIYVTSELQKTFKQYLVRAYPSCNMMTDDPPHGYSYTYAYRIVVERIKPNEFARIIGLNASTISSDIRNGKLKGFKDETNPKRVWLYVNDCYDYLRSNPNRTYEQFELFNQRICLIYQIIREDQERTFNKWCDMVSTPSIKCCGL